MVCLLRIVFKMLYKFAVHPKVNEDRRLKRLHFCRLGHTKFLRSCRGWAIFICIFSADFNQISWLTIEGHKKRINSSIRLCGRSPDNLKKNILIQKFAFPEICRPTVLF